MKGLTRSKFNSHDPRKTKSVPKQQTGFELIKLGGKSKFTKPISCYWSLSIPPENIRKPDLFLIFSGCIVREEWVDKNLRTQRLFHPSTSFLSLHFWLYGFLQVAQFCKFLAFKYIKKFSYQSRSSVPEVLCKKGVLKNFAKFTGKCLCQGLVFNKGAALVAVSVNSRSTEQVKSNLMSIETNCETILFTFIIFKMWYRNDLKLMIKAVKKLKLFLKLFLRAWKLRNGFSLNFERLYSSESWVFNQNDKFMWLWNIINSLH